MPPREPFNPESFMSLPAKAALVAAALASAFGFLTWTQNRTLVGQLAACRRAAAAQSTQVFQVGMELPAFTAFTTRGQELRVPPRHDGRSVVLFYGLNDCPPCEGALEHWIELHERLRELGSRAPVTGVVVGSPEAAAEHARARGVPFDVVAFPDQATLDRYHLTQLPVSAVIDAAGRVEHFWARTLGRGEIADMLQLVCPECLDRVAAPAQD